MPNALIFGCAGQDGAYLSRLLLDKGYAVTGVARRSSRPNLENLDALHIRDSRRFSLAFGDITDSGFLARIISRAAATEVYNLAALSDVAASFDLPDATLHTNAIGTSRLLEALRDYPGVRFYQASTSELFGDSSKAQNEDTPFRPMSPYAASKLAAFWMTRIYRDGYGMHASNGILYNHESKLRADCFVTQKIARHVAHVYHGTENLPPLRLGNLDACRDWGHAEDFVRGMWLMTQQETPSDYVLATGETHSVREFVDAAFADIERELEWRTDADGKPTAWIGQTNVVVGNDPTFIRPLDVPFLQGDASKARRVLGWEPTHSFSDIVREMVGDACDRLQAR